MAKIVIQIPEPSPVYSPEQQRQVLQTLDTLQNQLNFFFSTGLEK
jgi:hypothetical protein